MAITKGEWYKQGDSVYAKKENNSMVLSSDRLVAVVYPVEVDEDLVIECRDNTLLLAAAPDLLKACIMSRNAIATLAETSEPAKNCLKAINKAIKKATINK